MLQQMERDTSEERDTEAGFTGVSSCHSCLCAAV